MFNFGLLIEIYTSNTIRDHTKAGVIGGLTNLSIHFIILPTIRFLHDSYLDMMYYIQITVINSCLSVDCKTSAVSILNAPLGTSPLEIFLSHSQSI